MGSAAGALDRGMVTPICDKCRRRNVVSFQVEPKDAWRTVVLNRWRTICPSCFDAEADAPACAIGSSAWARYPGAIDPNRPDATPESPLRAFVLATQVVE